MNNAGQDSLLSKEQGECTINSEQLMEACEQEYQAGFHDGYEEGTKNYSRTVEMLKDLINRMSERTTQLTAERDAAISAIERSCKYCKKGNSCDDYDCITDRVDNWEWRGLSLAAETSDKEEE